MCGADRPPSAAAQVRLTGTRAGPGPGPGRSIARAWRHRWVGLAAIDAARDAGNRWVFPELLADGLEPWRDIQYIFTSGSPHLTHATDVTDFMDKGVESLEAHRVYIDNLPDKTNPDEFLRWIAAAVGERFGCEYAVGFEVSRIN